jgi:hypothetical protein
MCHINFRSDLLDVRDREWWEVGENSTMRSFSSLNIIRVIKSGRMYGLDMWHAWVR